MDLGRLGLSIALALLSETPPAQALADPDLARSARAEAAAFASCSGYENGFPRVISETKLPTLIHCVGPVYPGAARAAGHQGLVMIQATIDSHGKVVSPRLAGEGSHASELDFAALEAITHWTFSPGKDVHGNTIETPLLATIEFWEDDADNVREKTCADYVRDSNWFESVSPQTPRTKMHLYYVVVERLAMDAFAARANPETIRSVGQRLPAALDATFDRCSAAPQSGFLTTLRAVIMKG